MLKLIVNQTDPDSGTPVTTTTQEAKNLFKSNNKPYTIVDTVEGPLTGVLIDPHFINVMRDADSNEYMAKMSKLEKYLYWDYVTYKSIVFSINIANPTYTDEQVRAAARIEFITAREYMTPEIVVEALSDYETGALVEVTPNADYDTLHTWKMD